MIQFRNEYQVNLWPLGTQLRHSKFGKVAYYGHCLDTNLDAHRVQLLDSALVASRDGDDMATVSAANLYPYK